MTTVTIRRNHQKITYFSVKGHTGFGSEGNDLVCAILSTASQYAVLGLEEVAEITNFSYHIADGFLECELRSLSPSERKMADVLLETMVLVMRQAEEQYPSHLKIEESEV